MSVSSERTFQAMAVAEYARKNDIGILAHGSTGAGNDQVRFEMIFQVLVPEMEVLAPIRELSLSREAEVEYLRKVGVNDSFEKHEYSINQGLWGTSVGGKETLTSSEGLPEKAFPSQLRATEPEKISIEFRSRRNYRGNRCHPEIAPESLRICHRTRYARRRNHYRNQGTGRI